MKLRKDWHIQLVRIVAVVSIFGLAMIYMWEAAHRAGLTEAQTKVDYEEAITAYEAGNFAYAFDISNKHRGSEIADFDSLSNECKLQIYLELGWYHYYDQAYSRAYYEFQEVKRLDGDGHNYDYLDETIEECYERATEE